MPEIKLVLDKPVLQFYKRVAKQAGLKLNTVIKVLLIIEVEKRRDKRK